MSKKSKQHFEFCVGTSNSHRSTVWRIVINESDIYIMSEAYGRSAKISLHKSGVCQIAMTSELTRELGILKEERPSERWYYTSPKNTGNIVFTIDILNHFLSDFSEKEETKPGVKYIVPPEDGRLTEILFYKINTDSPFEGETPDGYNHLCDYKLSNGEYFMVCYHYPKFTEHNQRVYSNGYNQIIKKIESANLTSTGMIGYMTTEPFDGQCRLIEIFV